MLQVKPRLLQVSLLLVEPLIMEGREQHEAHI
jgi:hypothetical protein